MNESRLADQENRPESAEARFARRNAMFRFWRSWPVTIGSLAGYGVFFALITWVHWNVLAAAGVVIGAGIAIRVVMDIWPRKVPRELSGEVARMQARGSRLRRRHLFLCTEKFPHAHMVMPGGTPLTVIWRGESPPPPGSGVRQSAKSVIVVKRWHGTEEREG